MQHQRQEFRDDAKSARVHPALVVAHPAQGPAACEALWFSCVRRTQNPAAGPCTVRADRRARAGASRPQALHLQMLWWKPHLFAGHFTRLSHARTTRYLMIVPHPTCCPDPTQQAVSRERAPGKQRISHLPAPMCHHHEDLGLKAAVARRCVYRIAVRFDTRPPQSGFPSCDTPLPKRKSLTLSPELKSHIA